MADKFYLPVPPQGLGVWAVRIEIEDVFYRFLYKYNKRDSSWYFDLANDAGESQVRGRRVVLGSDILEPFKHLQVPQGLLSIVDTTGTGVDPSKEDLGDRVQLEYTTVL